MSGRDENPPAFRGTSYQCAASQDEGKDHVSGSESNVPRTAVIRVYLRYAATLLLESTVESDRDSRLILTSHYLPDVLEVAFQFVGSVPSSPRDAGQFHRGWRLWHLAS